MTIDSIMNPTRPTKQQVASAMQITLAVAEAIRKAGRIPSGHLYAMLIGKVDIDGYQAMIRTLKNTGLVTESMNELIWTGPTFSDSRTLPVSPAGSPRELCPLGTDKPSTR